LTASLRLRDPLGERTFGSETALTMGGPGAAIPLPGIEAGVTVARITLREAALTLETLAPGVRCNGRPIEGSIALATGDVIQAGDARIFLQFTRTERVLRVDHLIGNETSPPSINPGDALLESAAASPPRAIPRVEFRAPVAGLKSVATVAKPRHWRWLAVAAGVALAVLGYLMSVVALPFRIDPADARVEFADTIGDFRVGDRLYALAGDHELLAERGGYKPLRRVVNVGGGAVPLVLVLEKLPGLLTVNAGSVRGTVVIDGREAGASGAPLSVAPGHHTLVVRAPRHLDALGDVEIEGMGKRQEKIVELTPAWAKLSIESKPAGATVAIDGHDAGKTPLAIDADAGRHQITITDPAFRPWATELLVKANEPQTIGPVELGLPDGTVTLRSTPPGADVTAGGKYRGRTPVTFDLAAAASQEVVVQAEGYEPATEHLRVGPGEKRSVEVKLKEQRVAVTVRGEPNDAELWIDGVARGASAQQIELTPLEHRIEVRKAGFDPFVTQLKPQAGFAQLIEYRLRTPLETRTDKFPPTIKSATGYVLNLMPPGTYQIGSARRDPGRRTNETQREVKLVRLFYMGVTEVTNAEFRQFHSDHNSGLIKDRTLDLDKHPVVSVAWSDAAAYCNWLSAKDGLPEAYEKRGDSYVLKSPANTGYRLPTEAEWEWVARYDHGSATRRYPWNGSTLPPPAHAGNYADASAALLVESVIVGYQDGFPVSAPVGTFGADALGLDDIGGNVSEWVNDSYSLNLDLGPSVTDPPGPATSSVHTIRGSSWMTAQIAELRLTYRDYSGDKRIDLGFRVARYAE
jgi:formylglycine-generating enzyme required for sulfatase activity